jgi:hypothetical protein
VAYLPRAGRSRPAYLAPLARWSETLKLLGDRNVLVVPDVICNAGGVTVSYFEWVQDFSSFFWSEDEINARLDKIMVDALRKIWDAADRHKVSLRTATFAVACERIPIAREERGYASRIAPSPTPPSVREGPGPLGPLFFSREAAATRA